MFRFSFTTICICLFFCVPASAFEEIVTVPAEEPAGVVLELDAGDYTCEYFGGAISLFYPINPNYCWLIGTAIGLEAEGGQDYPDIGTIYFDPNPRSATQYNAEVQALAGVQKGEIGTIIDFSLSESARVRFWVSDYDYSDNSGMIKLKVSSKD